MKLRNCSAFGRQASWAAPKAELWRTEVEAGRRGNRKEWGKRKKKMVRSEGWCPSRGTSVERLKPLQACSPLWPLLGEALVGDTVTQGPSIPSDDNEGVQSPSAAETAWFQHILWGTLWLQPWTKRLTHLQKPSLLSMSKVGKSENPSCLVLGGKIMLRDWAYLR